MSDPIRIILNGDAVEIEGVSTTTTLLQWLREHRRLTGAKEGCAEGDCGACSVAIREPGDAWRAVNACIVLLPMLHGCELVTVEHLRGADGGLHPVQDAVAKAHGSQCGFCTPGFIMSLWAGYEEGASTDPKDVADRLAGNLCRCTGYGPLIAAAEAAEAYPRAPSPCARPINAGPLAYSAHGRTFWSPTSLSEAARLKRENPDARLLSGATDVGLWVTKHGFDPEQMIHLGRVEEMRRIEEGDDDLIIGGAVAWEQARSALAPHYPDLGELIRRVAGAQVRGIGSVGGNIANGSPIGDLPPALIALGSKVRLVTSGALGDATRELPLEDFFIEYGRQNISRYEILASVVVPKNAPGALRCYKISKRFDSDITAVLGCFRVVLDGETVADARLAYGGMAGTPQRAQNAEAALIGAPWSKATVDAARAALETDFKPLSDQRASAAYRLKVAQNLLTKYHLEIASPETATRLVGRDAVAL